MRARITWTAALDQKLRSLRYAGLTWDQVAAELELGRNTVLERARRIDARGPRRLATAVVLEPRDRPARPPGHPATWELLTNGTVLQGQPYPYPVFLYEQNMNSVSSDTGSSRSAVPHGTLDAAYVLYRLEEAGSTLLALPSTGHSTRLRLSQLDVVHSALEAYGWASGRMRPPVPSAAQISRMDQALDWIRLIPDERYVLRRILGARSLVNPVTNRHLYSWRRLGSALGADHKAVQRWHGQGLDMIVAALTALKRTEGLRSQINRGMPC